MFLDVYERERGRQVVFFPYYPEVMCVRLLFLIQLYVAMIPCYDLCGKMPGGVLVCPQKTIYLCMCYRGCVDVHSAVRRFLCFFIFCYPPFVTKYQSFSLFFRYFNPPIFLLPTECFVFTH